MYDYRNDYEFQKSIRPVSKLERCIRAEGIDFQYLLSQVEEEERKLRARKSLRAAGNLIRCWVARMKLFGQIDLKG